MKTRRDVFQAIADPTRRGIIMLLTVGSMTPNAIPNILTAADKPYQSTCMY